MPRPRSEEKRCAILAAATRVIVEQGLGAPTATIAREAGLPNGSLFTYFETKAVLFNQLYLDLKTSMTSAALEGLSEGDGLYAQFLRVWSNWTRWAIEWPEKRRALALLEVSDEITRVSRLADNPGTSSIAALMERSRANGPLRDAPYPFVAALMNALAEATMDFMVQHPAQADEHARLGFEALWRMLN